MRKKTLENTFNDNILRIYIPKNIIVNTKFPPVILLKICLYHAMIEFCLIYDTVR